MNAAMNDRYFRAKEASERGARIREFRQEVVGRRITTPEVIVSRIVIRDGRILYRHLIDASREMGRGKSYWLEPVTA